MITILNSKPLKADTKMLEELTPGVIDRNGVFETTRVSGGKIFAWDAHMKRFEKGLRSLKMKMPCREQQLLKYSRQVIRDNKIKDGSLRISAWKDGGMNFSVIVRSGVPAVKEFKAVVATPAYRSSCAPRVKSLKYSFFRKAFLSAQKEHSDEAVVLNSKKKIVEGSRTNIFSVKNNCIFTPPLSSGCLDGVARAIVLKLCRQSKIKCRTANLTVKDLLRSDEAFCTNSVSGIIPLVSVKDRKIGTGKAGLLTSRLSKLFAAHMRADLI